MKKFWNAATWSIFSARIPARVPSAPRSALPTSIKAASQIGCSKRKGAKNIAVGIAHILSTFNNTNVSITDMQGNVIGWSTAGRVGFKGSRKSTPFAAQVTADAAARKGMEHGLQKVDVFVKGPGSGRETAIRSLQAAGLEVTSAHVTLTAGSAQGIDNVAATFISPGDIVVTVVGNLTNDPELRFTPSGAAVASFTVESLTTASASHTKSDI